MPIYIFEFREEIQNDCWVIAADSRFAPGQWKPELLCNDVSHWLGANLKSAVESTLIYIRLKGKPVWFDRHCLFREFKSLTRPSLRLSIVLSRVDGRSRDPKQITGVKQCTFHWLIYDDIAQKCFLNYSIICYLTMITCISYKIIFTIVLPKLITITPL